MMLFVLFLGVTTTHSQTEFPKHQVSVNGFRNPSIGLEYQYKQLSIHAGYYVTNLETNVTTEFAKIGLTYWIFPF